MHDQLLRGEVVNRISARLGVPAADLKALVRESPRQSSSRQVVFWEAPSISSDDTALLCVLALRSEEAHRFLLAQNWRAVLSHLPYAYFLQRILESGLRPNDPASLSVFMTTLEREEQDVLSGWLHLKTPPDEVAVSWQRLHQDALRRQIEAAQSQIGSPGLTIGEQTNLQKEIVDLRQQLHEFCRPVGGGDT